MKFHLSHEMTWIGDRQWHNTDGDVISDAMLAEGFCPRGHGPLVRSAHPEFYAWCHTCQAGWGIQSIHHGEDRIDIQVDRTKDYPGDPSGYPGGAGPEQLTIYELDR